MSSNHHTPYPFGTALTAALMNVPTGQLDQTITDVLAGDEEFTRLQVGAGGAETAAAAQINSTTKGFLPPRMTTTQRDAIASPPEGLVVWNTDTNALNYYSGAAWLAISASSGALTELISLTALSASAGISLTSLSSAYQDLILRIRVRSTVAAFTDSIRFRLNNDSGASNYAWNFFYGSSSVLNTSDAADDGVDVFCTGANSSAGSFAELEFKILNYTEATNTINGLVKSSFLNNAALNVLWGTFSWVGGAAVNRIDFAALAGNMNGSYSLFGAGS